ncbi:MAG: glycosyl transferase group 1 [Thermoleophilia bacterium]|nr:glycosyl transferase group 1 [Thermoleophilia bacterium]
MTTLAIWHGYLLGATGSNIYTYELVQSWVQAGHDVVLACQDAKPELHPSVHDVVRLKLDAATGVSRVADRRSVRQPEPGHGRCTVVVADLGGVLPVYVIDRYAGFEVVRLVDMSVGQRERYAAAHASAMRWVLGAFANGVDGVLINHATPLPAALSPVLVDAGVPYAVKVHGSELEYAIVDDPSLVEPSAAALTAAASVLVGSAHIERRTAELLGRECLAGHTSIVPPGVDLERFAPIAFDDRGDAHETLVTLLENRAKQQPQGRTPKTSFAIEQLVESIAGDPERAAHLVPTLAALHGTYEERHIERFGSREVSAIDIAGSARLVVCVSKLIPQKGVHLLLAALPEVLDAFPDVEVVVAGFGPLRDGLEALLVAMRAGDVAAIDALATHMGELSGEGGGDLTHLTQWLAELRATDNLDTWLATAARVRIDERVSWLGLVDHDVLHRLWPLAELSVVPSELAEAFGMVAAEAAACGAVPIVADHSGLADAAAVIEHDGVSPVRFELGDVADGASTAVTSLRDTLTVRLSLPPEERVRQAAAARRNVANAWGWNQIAAEVAALMMGEAPAN